LFVVVALRCFLVGVTLVVVDVAVVTFSLILFVALTLRLRVLFVTFCLLLLLPRFAGFVAVVVGCVVSFSSC
jgi:hypothetical protein